ncbi:hypothetical protein Tsp_08032 [Trichinella spiralis]|uniref:hypothetical protein n=1 Tax=Trichinella spiralis TaxID=6334 RepID=UPI0001EFDD50|nr:hypothetical protein Tsp_08032 [Trichinella spiralis]
MPISNLVKTQWQCVIYVKCKFRQIAVQENCCDGSTAIITRAMRRTKCTATCDIWCDLFDLNEIQILHKICACRYEYLWRSPARVRQIGMAVFNLMQSYSTATSQTNVILIAIRILAELINGSRNC